MKILMKGLLFATTLVLATLPLSAQTPPAYLVFQNFEASDGLAAAQGATAVIDASGFVDKSTKSAKLSFESSGDPHEYLQNIIATPTGAATIDVSAYKYMFFWILDTQGKNTHMVTLVDAAGHMYTTWTSDSSQKDKWARINFPIKSATEKGVDLKTLKEVRIGEWNAGTYFFDDIIFTNDFRPKYPN